MADEIDFKMFKLMPDRYFCVGGRWNGWVFTKHADGHFVSSYKALEIQLVSDGFSIREVEEDKKSD